MRRTDSTDLDAALARWALGGFPEAPATLARLEMHAEATAALDRQPPTGFRTWRTGLFAGGAIAASAALALLLVQPEPAIRQAAAPAPVTNAGDPAASFALLYTPTTDEEYPL
jgi:hypothetical protein